MKAIKDSRVFSLRVDAVGYLFTEWLVRRGIFSAYKANYERHHHFDETFRDVLRDRIYKMFRSSRYVLSDLVDLSFPFASTPEGFYFWQKHSLAWRRFCNEFRNNL